MDNHYSIIVRAVSGLHSNTGEARRAIYERARTKVRETLRTRNPPLSETELTKELCALEAAIRKVEEDTAFNDEQLSDLKRLYPKGKVCIKAEAVCELYGDKQPTPDDGILGWVPGIKEQLASADDPDDEIELSLIDWNTHAIPDDVRAKLHDSMGIRYNETNRFGPEPTRKSEADEQPTTNQEAEKQIISLIEQLLTAQLMPKYKHLSDAFSVLMTNKLAAGYVFGFHDSCFQTFSRLDPNNPKADLSVIRNSYQTIFGTRPGFALFEMSIASQKDSEFQIGRQSGGEEYMEFIRQKTPPLELGRILILGFDAAAVWRTLDRNRTQSSEANNQRRYKPEQEAGETQEVAETQETAEKPTGVTDDDDRGFKMFWNKPKQEKEMDKVLNYTRALALRVIDTMKLDKTKDDIEPEERVLHLQALNMAATMYIVNAPDPRLCLRNFIEVLQDEVAKACKRMGR
jgi:hypothetical protein